jgi:hypothetical protein
MPLNPAGNFNPAGYFTLARGEQPTLPGHAEIQALAEDD